ncbi:HU family DNA-binding protein [Pseudokineococcus lusitanus]|uniref:DNA-binding protein HU-beta n=1 Tax=Pseudokineococcus lusitanus TaxID=763993 RepID=A0A3N1HMW5_9ACTN|nr:HU family DNA-binding protein [Pseudokineococcus lusitanus]ROP43789.1 DNA-binding protein HU-beta [Pseudokineococcus lusitanus]
MNKGELVDLLEQRLGSRRAASDAMESVLDAVVRAVARGERVAISGFGTFERADRAPRTGRNPRTGETVPIAGTSVPRFKPGTAFRAFVAEPGSLPEPGQQDPSAGGALRAATTRRGGVELSDRPAAPSRTTAAVADGTEEAGSAPAAVGAVGDAPPPAEDEKPAKGSKAKKKDAEPAKKPKAAKETKDAKDGKKAKGKKK